MHLDPFPYEYDLRGYPPYKLKWVDVLQIYRNNEEHLEHWKQYYQAQGYKNWEEWRKKFFKRFGLRQLRWDMFELTRPIIISYLRGADFQGWRKLTGDRYLTFGQMAMLESVKKHEPLRDLIKNFPSETTIIAIRHKECIFVIEGMHRCAAHALAYREGNIIPSHIKIVLGRKDKWFRPMFLGKRI
ncbi:MAG: hypothetical protein A2817_02155 [Candidatus Yanofskybacteria bacterium RIFCSPHIGHO2_01_FULL_39_8b]|uniref:Uncharacterized protein n=1 Tax=Candidatus Yanofskybacteria bacterium RIFCSPHIGHO2_01_FULL_39_8b TaxID=1802659 RepID=A0A1F8EGY2_9BACT|nr:MAG: hypothetical protein A2817_02155 [Candidatus Yanofskybacteria bacterium RIFCSPHIGHO2_01_FULL_39_8b]